MFRVRAVGSCTSLADTMLSRRRQIVYFIFVMTVSGIWYSRENTRHTGVYRVIDGGLLRSLQLSVNLHRNTTDRKVIVNTYINNLERQLSGKVQQEYKSVDEDVYRKRNLHVESVCKMLNKTRITPKQLREQTSIVQDPNILYCAVPKSGTTFWRRVIVALKWKDPQIKTPFLLSYSDFNINKMAFNRTYLKPQNRKKLEQFLSNSLKFVFIRDPYHRLFSSFVDKIYAPNTQFWEIVAKPALLKVRTFKYNPNNTCGQDLSFGELVRWLNTMEPRKYNEHLIPAAHKCDVCSVKYDVIGKMETFKSDMSYILQKTGSIGKYLQFHDMALEYKVDYIVDAVTRAFLFKHQKRTGWVNCISTHAANLRIWRQLQIVGLIHKKDPYPLSPDESDVIGLTEYLNMALEAFQRAPPDVKFQKQEAYLQAYSELSLEDLETIRLKYIDDLYLFDYDDRPNNLFKQATMPRRQWDFDYYDLLFVK